MHKSMYQPLMFLLLLTTMLLSTSCTRQDSRCANLMGNGRYCLQPTTTVAPFEVLQKVDATLKKRHETMVSDIAVNGEGMQIIILTPFGQKIAHVSYNNVEAKAVVSPDSRLDPTLMIAMIQLALWPVDIVRKGLSAPMLLEESDGHRRYLAKDNLVLDVSYANAMAPANKFNFSFPAVGLILDIETLPEIEHVQ
jgi:hypothetical protein